MTRQEVDQLHITETVNAAAHLAGHCLPRHPDPMFLPHGAEPEPSHALAGPVHETPLVAATPSPRPA